MKYHQSKQSKKYIKKEFEKRSIFPKGKLRNKKEDRMTETKKVKAYFDGSQQCWIKLKTNWRTIKTSYGYSTEPTKDIRLILDQFNRWSVEK